MCSGVFGSLVAGLIAGICGVTGWGGFLYYLAMHVVVRCVAPSVKTKQTSAVLKSKSNCFVRCRAAIDYQMHCVTINDLPQVSALLYVKAGGQIKRYFYSR